MATATVEEKPVTQPTPITKNSKGAKKATKKPEAKKAPAKKAAKKAPAKKAAKKGTPLQRIGGSSGLVMTETGLKIPENLSLDEGIAAFEELRRTGSAMRFAEGDLLIFLEDKYAEQHAQALDDTKWELKTIQSRISVCRFFKPSERRHELRYTHHRDATGLTKQAAVKALDDAVKHNMGVDRFREHVKALKADGHASDASKAREKAKTHAKKALWITVPVEDEEKIDELVMRLRATAKKAASEITEFATVTVSDSYITADAAAKLQTEAEKADEEG